MCLFIQNLTKEQRNYDIGNGELLAIIWALKEWWHYIQGSGHTTVVLSNHDNLWHFKVLQTIGRQMTQWTLYLSEFDIKLVHIPGKKNIQAGALSQRPDLCPEGIDNENVIVLPEHLFVDLMKLCSCWSFGDEHQMLEMRNKGTWLQLMCCAFTQRIESLILDK